MTGARSRDDDSRTDQLQTEIDGEHEPSALDREEDEQKARSRVSGRVEPEAPENTPEAHSGQADEIGIEIDNAAERPRQDE